MATKAEIKTAIQTCADASGDLDLVKALGDPAQDDFMLRGETVSAGIAYAIPGFLDCVLQGIATATTASIAWNITPVIDDTYDSGNHYNASINELVRADSENGTVYVDLPQITVTNKGLRVGIKAYNPTEDGYYVVVTADSGQTIDENKAGFIVLGQHLQWTWLVSDGVSDWIQMS